MSNSRTATILRLLADGPLRPSEVRSITGWTPRQCRKTLGHLTESGRITPAGQRGSYAINRPCAPGLDGEHARGQGSCVAQGQGNGADLPGTVGGPAQAADGGHAR